MRTAFCLALLGLLFLSACTKKDVDNSGAAKAALTANRWKLSTTVMVTASGEQAQTIATCKKDDLWEYKTDGTFALYPGTSLCSTSDKTYYGTWELLNDGKQLKVTITGAGSYTDDVKLIEPGKLQLTYTTNNVYVDTYVAN